MKRPGPHIDGGATCNHHALSSPLLLPYLPHSLYVIDSSIFIIIIRPVLNIFIEKKVYELLLTPYYYLHTTKRDSMTQQCNLILF